MVVSPTLNQKKSTLTFSLTATSHSFYMTNRSKAHFTPKKTGLFSKGVQKKFLEKVNESEKDTKPATYMLFRHKYVQFKNKCICLKQKALLKGNESIKTSKRYR